MKTAEEILKQAFNESDLIIPDYDNPVRDVMIKAIESALHQSKSSVSEILYDDFLEKIKQHNAEVLTNHVRIPEYLFDELYRFFNTSMRSLLSYKKWVSVETKPEKMGHYLVYREGVYPTIALFDEHWYDLKTSFVAPYYTHWMPLPNAPQL